MSIGVAIASNCAPTARAIRRPPPDRGTPRCRCAGAERPVSTGRRATTPHHRRLRRAGGEHQPDRAALTTGGVSVIARKPSNSPIASHAASLSTTGARAATTLCGRRRRGRGAPRRIARAARPRTRCGGIEVVVGHRHQLDPHGKSTSCPAFGRGARRGRHARRPARPSRVPRHVLGEQRVEHRRRRLPPLTAGSFGRPRRRTAST